MLKKKRTKSSKDAKKNRVTLDIRGKMKLAETFGVGRNTVDRWLSRGCPAKKVRGVWFFSFEAMDQWLQTREEGFMKPDPELTKQRARLVRLQADRKEIELLKMKGELLPVREAMHLWGNMIINFGKRLEAMENRLPPMLFGLSVLEIKETLSKYIFEMREELSNPDLKELAKKSAAKGGK
ncbi:MAG TPA: hypothetical protein PKY58_04890 [Syntrophales bacterium]|nr:hypothetical protein [Syntrophales bacterium]HQN77985.1 hypothetical protein [Syntrophales bacterium]HQQ26843.1 hypothetical protein [Syntrophales bacterium]